MPFGQLAVEHAALPSLQPVNNPHYHINVEAVMEEARRKDERWMQQMHNIWRNEQRAQQQLQQDEEQEQHQRWIEDRALVQRKIRLENITNNTPESILSSIKLKI